MALQYGIRDYKSRDLSLSRPQLQMKEYTPVEFVYKGIDNEALQRTVDKMDAADEKAKEKETEIDAYYAQQRKLIHNDAKSLALFDEKVNEYKQKVKEAVDNNMGSYHRLGKEMLNLSSEAVNDVTINGMVQQQAKYEEQRKTIEALAANGKLSNTRKKRYIDEMNRRFDNNFLYDNNRNIIGVDEWKSNIEIVDELDEAQFIAKIAALVPEQSKTTGGDTTKITQFDNPAKAVKNESINVKATDKYMGSVTSGGTHSRNFKTKEALELTFDDIERVDRQLGAQFRHFVLDRMYEAKEAEQRLNDPNISDIDRQDAIQQLSDYNRLFKGTGAGGGSVADMTTAYRNYLRELVGKQNYNRTSDITNYSESASFGGSSGGGRGSGNGGGYEITDAYVGDLGTNPRGTIRVPIIMGQTTGSFIATSNEVGQLYGQ